MPRGLPRGSSLARRRYGRRVTCSRCQPPPPEERSSWTSTTCPEEEGKQQNGPYEADSRHHEQQTGTEGGQLKRRDIDPGREAHHAGDYQRTNAEERQGGDASDGPGEGPGSNERNPWRRFRRHIESGLHDGAGLLGCGHRDGSRLNQDLLSDRCFDFLKGWLLYYGLRARFRREDLHRPIRQTFLNLPSFDDLRCPRPRHCFWLYTLRHGFRDANNEHFLLGGTGEERTGRVPLRQAVLLLLLLSGRPSWEGDVTVMRDTGEREGTLSVFYQP